MKVKVLKRLIALVMSALLMLGASVSAFATEVSTDTSVVASNVTNIDSNDAVSTRSNTYACDTCDAFDSLTMYITLDSYIGLKRTLHFSANSFETDKTPSGYVIVEVFKPNGDVLDKFVAYPDVEYVGE